MRLSFLHKVHVCALVGAIATCYVAPAAASHTPANFGALAHETELPAGATTIAFNGWAVNLTTQYAGSGVTLSGLRRSGSGYARMRNGYTTATMTFSPVVQAVGLYVENGAVYESPPSTSESARFFVLSAYDSGGSLLGEYRWRTAQSGSTAGFYGLYSTTTAIASVTLSVLDSGPIALDRLRFSTSASLRTSQHDAGCAATWGGTGLWHEETVVSDDTDGDGVADVDTAFDHCNRSDGSHSGTLSGGVVSSTYWACNDPATGDYRPELQSSSYLCSPSIVVNDPGCVNPDVQDTDGDGYEESEVQQAWPYHAHWTHFHLGGLYETEEDGSYSGTDTSYSCGDGANPTMGGWCPNYPEANPSDDVRTLEYSLDNGTTWRDAWWYKDLEVGPGGVNHRGTPGNWNYAHGHPFMDSWRVDGDGDGVYDELDTDFYLAELDTGLCPTPGTTSSCNDSWDNDGYYRYATSVRYRLGFFSDGDGSGTCADVDGDGTGCEGWWVDDVAFSNDEGHCGACTDDRYYDFED